jgi:hypothetical protein
VAAFDPLQAPLWQVSVCVHAMPSLQAVPFGAAGFEQPAAGSQVPATWHASLATQVTRLEPVQEPALHTSVWVQTFPSLHAVPSAAGGFVHAPLAASQVPGT